MAGALRPTSFCLSASHHGLKTAPGGDCYNNLTNLSIDSIGIKLRKFQIPTGNIQVQHDVADCLWDTSELVVSNSDARIARG
jgi:hypothetical protein